MSESKHTPGPWTVVVADDYEIHSAATPEQFPHRCKEDDLGRFVAQVGNRANDFGESDARLIAAAPDLVKALHDVVYQQPNDVGAYSRAISLLHSLNAALAECAKPLSEVA